MAKQKKILIFENSYAISNFLVKFWQEKANQAIHFKNYFSVALSGGKTPVEFYCRLSNLTSFDLWSQTHLFFADERFVPADHNANNARMVKENLLQFVNIPQGNIHPIATDVKNVSLAAALYRERLVDYFGLKAGQFPRFDLILLGIGEDGHTASLFPGQDLEETKNMMVVPVSLNSLEEERISLSLSVLNNARQVVFLVLGDKKADIVSRVIEGKNDLPAAQVLPADGEVLFLLDKEAAQKISYQDSSIYEDEAIAVYR